MYGQVYCFGLFGVAYRSVGYVSGGSNGTADGQDDNVNSNHHLAYLCDCVDVE